VGVYRSLVVPRGEVFGLSPFMPSLEREREKERKRERESERERRGRSQIKARPSSISSDCAPALL